MPYVSVNGVVAQATDVIPDSKNHHFPDGNKIRSLRSVAETRVKFVNDLDVPVHTLWLNYAGDEVYYFTLPPGCSYSQHTFVSHPWTFRCAAGDPWDVVCDGRRVVFPMSRRITVRLTRPERMSWSIERHRLFAHDPAYRAVQEVLLAHNRCVRRLMEGLMEGPSTPKKGFTIPSRLMSLKRRWLGGGGERDGDVGFGRIPCDVVAGVMCRLMMGEAEELKVCVGASASRDFCDLDTTCVAGRLDAFVGWSKTDEGMLEFTEAA